MEDLTLKIDFEREVDAPFNLVEACVAIQLKEHKIAGIHIYEPEVKTPREYLDFAEGKLHELVFHDSNGTAMIAHLDATAVFSMDRFGAGGDVGFDIVLPFNLVADAMRQIAAEVSK